MGLFEHITRETHNRIYVEAGNGSHYIWKAKGEALRLDESIALWVHPTSANNQMWEGEPAQRVVCAANRYEGKRIVLGARHWDSFMRETCAVRGFIGTSEEQGFIDQMGNFLSRTEAWKVAEAAKQIVRRVGGDTKDGGTLYSENLY